MIQLQSTVLEAPGIRLEPMRETHHDALMTAAADGRLWELWYVAVPAPDETAAYIADALKGQEAAHMLPWVVRDTGTGAIIGSTRYHDVVAHIDRVEIGYTWYSESRQRTHVNTTCKLLLLRMRSTHLAARWWDSGPTRSTFARSAPSRRSAPGRTACCATSARAATARRATS